MVFIDDIFEEEIFEATGIFIDDIFEDEIFSEEQSAGKSVVAVPSRIMYYPLVHHPDRERMPPDIADLLRKYG